MLRSIRRVNQHRRLVRCRTRKQKHILIIKWGCFDTTALVEVCEGLRVREDLWQAAGHSTLVESARQTSDRIDALSYAISNLVMAPSASRLLLPVNIRGQVRFAGYHGDSNFPAYHPPELTMDQMMENIGNLLDQIRPERSIVDSLQSRMARDLDSFTIHHRERPFWTDEAYIVPVMSERPRVIVGEFQQLPEPPLYVINRAEEILRAHRARKSPKKVIGYPTLAKSVVVGNVKYMSVRQAVELLQQRPDDDIEIHLETTPEHDEALKWERLKTGVFDDLLAKLPDGWTAKPITADRESWDSTAWNALRKPVEDLLQ